MALADGIGDAGRRQQDHAVGAEGVVEDAGPCRSAPQRPGIAPSGSGFQVPAIRIFWSTGWIATARPSPPPPSVAPVRPGRKVTVPPVPKVRVGGARRAVERGPGPRSRWCRARDLPAAADQRPARRRPARPGAAPHRALSRSPPAAMPSVSKPASSDSSPCARSVRNRMPSVTGTRSAAQGRTVVLHCWHRGMDERDAQRPF